MLGRLFFLPNIWNVTRIFLVDPFFFNPDRTPGGHIYYVSFFFFWDIYNLPVKFPEYVHHVSYVFLHNSHLSFFSALWNIPYIWPSRPRIRVSTMTTLYVISLLNLLVEVFFCFFFEVPEGDLVVVVAVAVCTWTSLSTHYFYIQDDGIRLQQLYFSALFSFLWWLVHSGTQKRDTSASWGPGLLV